MSESEKLSIPVFTFKKIVSIFGAEVSRNALIRAEESGQIPSPERLETGSVKRRSWTIDDLPTIGEKYGYLKKPERPIVISTFTTKGGVLKTTLALNIARTAALHNIRTCVVGLDLQGDVSLALGMNSGIEDAADMDEAIQNLRSPKGLFDVQQEELTLDDVVTSTDIPTLSFIPETPELVHLEQHITAMNRREYWLKDKVIEPLKKKFDLIILDCSPNWNRLVTNALAASDVLISPLECKINNFRNFEAFIKFLNSFKKEMGLNFQTVFVPTRFSSNRKLSVDIKNWYMSNASGCIHSTIRESAAGEEAMAQNLSLPEYAPTSLQADEMREVLREVWSRIVDASKKAISEQVATPIQSTPYVPRVTENNLEARV